MKNLVEVIFRSERTGYFNNINSLDLEPDFLVICRVDRGEDIARIVNISIDNEDIEKNTSVNNILRIANEEDLAKLEIVKQKELEAEKKFNKLLEKQKVNMKLVEVVYQFDGNKMIFFFSAEGRVDFRDFVRELASEFKTRIELHQTSGREDARRYGGLGICGKEYCCVLYLKKLNQVTIKMAKDQNLLSNMSKISGPCGRLLCCLHYEKDFYIEKTAQFPKVNERILYNNKEMRVRQIDFYKDQINLSAKDENIVITLKDYEKITKKKVSKGNCKNCPKTQNRKK
jgi:cell fate regulator YaaT (PSP1 superfamily)